MIVQALLLQNLYLGCSAGFEDTDKGSGIDNNITPEPEAEEGEDGEEDGEDGLLFWEK